MRSRWPGPAPRGDGGFTLVETLVTLTILIMVLSSLLMVFLSSQRGIGLARQRQQAAGVAGGAMEQLRALPYSVVTSGHTTSDLAGDANVVTSGGIKRLVIASVGVDEPLVVAGTGSSAAPLSPHTSQQVVDRITYTVSSYVTRVSTQSPYGLTVVVSWQQSSGAATRTQVLRSALFSPSGCLSPDSHPFSGPCVATFSGQAAATGATVTVTGTSGVGTPVPGFGGSALTVSTAGTRSSLIVEQIAQASSRAATARATLDGAESSSGRSVLVNVSTDPTANLQTGGTSSVTGPAAAPLALTGTAGTITATPSGGDPAQVAGYVAGAPGCTDALGGSLAAQRPCATGAVGASIADAVVRADLTGTAPTRALPVFDLARIASPTLARVTVTQPVAAGTAACPTTSGAGCSYAAASRTMGTSVFGGLPAASAGDTVPAGFTGLVRLVGLSETARAEAGQGERAVSFTRAGTLSLWNGTGYTSLDLATLALPATPAGATVTGRYPGAGGEVVVTASATVTVGATGQTSTGTLPCVAATCARSGAGGTVTVSVTYDVVAAGREVTRYLVTTDLGSLLASASYTGAPSA